MEDKPTVAMFQFTLHMKHSVNTQLIQRLRQKIGDGAEMVLVFVVPSDLADVYKEQGSRTLSLTSSTLVHGRHIVTDIAKRLSTKRSANDDSYSLSVRASFNSPFVPLRSSTVLSTLKCPQLSA